ncbi:TPA: DUF2868 domain-containing protein [Neisseria gonorrhoeae]|uniref:DUF2868 domain-containing protein n=1 Tax=Neisseria gonorrhoeae TaxID=485 RepID=UPI0021F208B6|nr:DUF2868 domain-containing protein [Neisseria gonorrhoeae]UYM69822.1 DUF2868 domain-containing protein [Neisseria gonorrhoeae]
MLNPSRKLVELVRILDEGGFIFSGDPVQATEALRRVDGSTEEKIIRRSEMIDRDRMLRDTLERVRAGSFWLWVVVASMMFTAGFSGTYLLMDNQGLNFFLVLAGVLGMNTLMLAVWLATLFLRVKVGRFFSSPATWFRGKGPVNQAVLRLYADQWRQPSVRWKIGATAHSLWLCTLLGMLVSVLLLLLVRQYTFNWESTLLSNAASVRAVEMLAWLPSKLGFPVPDARAWSGLLVGSIVCYGILPRLLAWVVCKILLKTSENGLDLEKTYYQAVIRRWQNKITDADTRRETVSAVSPKIVLNDAPKWALMLETEWQDGQWFEGRLAQEWLDKGVAANREQVAALETELKQKPAQLLIGVRAQTVPDRGVLRQIVRLSEAAQGGAVVQLLAEQGLSDDLSEKLEHWRNALTECGAAWLEPDRVAQEGRLKDQ